MVMVIVPLRQRALKPPCAAYGADAEPCPLPGSYDDPTGFYDGLLCAAHFASRAHPVRDTDLPLTPDLAAAGVAAAFVTGSADPATLALGYLLGLLAAQGAREQARAQLADWRALLGDTDLPAFQRRWALAVADAWPRVLVSYGGDS